jgi:LysR family transcriptional regulator, positive regulator for ilvC
MDTRQLELFIKLSENLHFGATGVAMHMSASAVSRTVKRMEVEVGQRLLERDNRSVRLTDVGRQFQSYAREALANWQSFNEIVRREVQGLSGEVSVFCSVTAAYSVLSDILEPFRRRYPDIEIKLRTGDQADAIDHLLGGDDDIAIAARPDKLSSRLHFQTLSYSPLLFIYPATPCAVQARIVKHIEQSSRQSTEKSTEQATEQGRALNCTEKKSAEQASEQGQALNWGEVPLIVSERGLARTRLDQWLRLQNVKPNIYAQVSGHEAIVSMVGLGFGVGIVPELVLTNSPMIDKVRVFDVQPALEPFAVGLCALGQRLQNPLVKAFWDCAKASYRNEF